MFGFSKRSKQKPVSDQIINNDDIPENNSTISDDNETETFLSIPPDWKLSNEDRYIYAFYNHQSPKLRINQVSIYGMEMKKVRDNKLEVTGLIRNTVQKNIQFKETSILLLGNQNEIIARDTFNLKLMGKIPPNGARPWNFAFSLSEEETHDIEMMQGTWSLAFEMKREHKLELDKSWEETIAKELKSNLERITANAAPLKPGEVNIMGLKAELNEKKELVVTLLIRNGSNKKITFNQIPLGFSDASNKEVAKGSFNLGGMEVNANTSKPWTFVFPANFIEEIEIDLSRWQVYLLKNR